MLSKKKMLKSSHKLKNRGKHISGSLFILFVIFGILIVSAAQTQVIKVGSEYKIKAAFIYNLAQFTEWPEDTLANTNDVFCIGVLGENPFGDNLDEIAKEKLLKKSRVEIKYSNSLQDVIDCQVLYISTLDKNEIRKIIQKLKGKSILTISDQAMFTEIGGIVNFINVQGKVRFAINIDAAERAHLSLSSNLLKLAKIVAD